MEGCIGAQEGEFVVTEFAEYLALSARPLEDEVCGSDVPNVNSWFKIAIGGTGGEEADVECCCTADAGTLDMRDECIKETRGRGFL